MSRRASEQGAVAPASLLAAAVVAIAVGAAGYALTSGHNEQTPQSPHTQVQPTTSATGPASSSPVTPIASPAASPSTAAPIDRSSYNVAVFNQSTIKGLAARTSTKAQNIGWKVVATSQWLGSISTSTVYYPPSMQAAAQQLADDLGITSIKPAVSPMQMDRLTVILTSTYKG